MLYVALLSASLAVLRMGIRDLHELGIDDPFSQGFGTMNPNAIFTYPATFSTTVPINTTTHSVVQTNYVETFFADVIIVNTPNYCSRHCILCTSACSQAWSQQPSGCSLQLYAKHYGSASQAWVSALPIGYSFHGSIVFPYLLHRFSYIGWFHEVCLLSESTFSDGVAKSSLTGTFQRVDTVL